MFFPASHFTPCTGVGRALSEETPTEVWVSPRLCDRTAPEGTKLAEAHLQTGQKAPATGVAS